jgi:prepilin-type processing-associated H-X9-DG protein
MQCVILAGGLGTRMGPLTERVAKTLLPVMGHPFAEYQLRWLSGQGVRSVVYCIGFLGEQIRTFVGDGSRWGFERVTYVDDGPRLMGTGGALRRAHETGALEEGFLVVYGDSYIPVEIAPIWRTSEAGRVPVLTVLRNGGRWDASNAVFHDGHVMLYEKGRADAAAIGMDYIDYGLSVLPRKLVAENIPSNKPHDLAALYGAISRRGGLRGFEVVTRFYEIGSPGGLRDLEEHLKSAAGEERDRRVIEKS